MKLQSKNSFFLFSAVWLLILLAAANAKAEKVEALEVGSKSLAEETVSKKLKVGVIAGLTGDWASYGEAGRIGIELAEQGQAIDFIYEDDQFQSAKAVAAFRKLHSEDRVDAVIVSDSATAAALAPIAKKEKVPMLAWSSEDSSLKGNDFTIRLWPKNNKEVDFAINNFKIKNSAKTEILVSEHPYADLWGAEIYNSLSLRYASILQLPWNMQDYRSIILRARQRGVENFVLCLSPGFNGRFAQQLVQLNFKRQIFGCNLLESVSDLRDAGGSLEGTIITGTKIKSEFKEKYIAKNMGSDHLLTAAIHYDAAIVLGKAAASDSKKDLINKILELKSYTGAHGKVEIISKSGDQYLDFPFTLYEVRSGNLIEILVD